MTMTMPEIRFERKPMPPSAKLRPRSSRKLSRHGTRIIVCEDGQIVERTWRRNGTGTHEKNRSGPRRVTRIGTQNASYALRPRASSHAPRHHRLVDLSVARKSKFDPVQNQRRRRRSPRRRRRISSSSTTPEAAFHPWSSNDAMNVAPYASPARLVSRGGAVLGNASHCSAARDRRSGSCTAPCFRAAHRSRPGSRPASATSSRSSSVSHSIRLQQRTSIDAANRETRKLAVEHVPHRRRKQPHAGARASQHAPTARWAARRRREGRTRAPAARQARPDPPPDGSRESRSAACRRTRRW